MFGRCFKVGPHGSGPDSALYFVAEGDPIKALRILQAEMPDGGLCFDDRGPVTQQLIDALDLKPGEFRRAP